ncbi:dethiobiotin synthetase [Campylobacter blaseri]|uniref:ATP-dependent dethiobiotin synthetase BioD n=1 Tax=Campylobacter blaseri TaxID=2042961 RepID=A0A2P8R3T4_9BACT|nr:dethiobiotin synthase [Campylobacter blaseri]PSM53143.1 dethiobiotin synthase [Campylobacter blaseri]PSM54609.1 dethiobiotin synthase [Campylobacter blaseri]QKF86918.1 dethiobiotin synthetase [Campylobacter blaseri]
MKELFITATGTDVGKTYVSALICKNLMQSGLNVGYFKPVASGNIKDENGNLRVGDVSFVKEFANLSFEVKDMHSYAYERAYSPHLATKFEGNPPVKDKILKDIENLKKKCDFLVVEGSGGVICPFRWDEQKIMQLDIIKALNYEVLIVADSGLGGINSAILTTEYLKNHNIKIKGFALNNYDETNPIHKDNKTMIEMLSGLNVLFTVQKEQKNIDFRP